MQSLLVVYGAIWQCNTQRAFLKKKYLLAVSSVEWFMLIGLNMRRILENHCIVSVPVVIILLELTVHCSAVPVVLLWTSRRLRLKTIEGDE
nr:MAG TPA: hypothetical protein [Caudoviricetes sp.]DAQ57312.1 MAG TPA: hypothetical protein [Bacteriophage sp.]DAT80437.1 MAG TPA: hypothetical protein [Bacteriophage sp.]DAU56977.1 MAG TPA: hypothetical protein [Caudoviricetes sp.]